MKRLAEVTLLVGVCYLIFFTNLSRHDYIGTEALRSTVVKEMLERDGLTMPTVHHVPYLKKPPLHAWTVTTLARTVGRFDEQIARLPSAIFGTLLVVLLYGVGERWIGRGGGLVAGVLALLSPSLMDYGVRAELDLPFSFFCVANLVATLAALRAIGWRTTLYWLAAYALALLAAMWKGPHSLIFMMLTMTTFGWLTGQWRFLRAPAQWVGLAVTLGALLAWSKALGDFAGSAAVGRAAGIELLARLIPHRFSHVLGMGLFAPIFAIVTLPASAFALMLLHREVRSTCGLAGGASEELSLLKRGIAHLRTAARSNPLVLCVSAWLGLNLVFMCWAPAKASRYLLPLFPPVILLGGWVALLSDSAARDSALGRRATQVWRAMFGLFALTGIAGGVAWINNVAGMGFGPPALRGNAFAWGMLAVGGLAPLFVELSRRGGARLRARLMMGLVFALCVQPALHDVWWPMRVGQPTNRNLAAQIDALVPEGSEIYVLGRHTFHHLAIYAERSFTFAKQDVADLRVDKETMYAILRRNERQDFLEETTDYELLYDADQAKVPFLLVKFNKTRNRKM